MKFVKRLKHSLIALLLSLFSTLFSEHPNHLRGDNAGQPLFRASFENYILADEAGGRNDPLSNQGGLIAPNGKKGACLFIDWGGQISFSAVGNAYPQKGTLSFWWQIDEEAGETPFTILRISSAQNHSLDYSFAHLFWTGQSLKLKVFDRESKLLEINPELDYKILPGSWMFLAFTWNELAGVRLYVNGKEVGSSLGQFHFGHLLDQIGIQTEVLTPYQRKGSHRKVFVDELMIYSTALAQNSIEDLFELRTLSSEERREPLTPQSEVWRSHWANRFQWASKTWLPSLGSFALFRKVRILSAQDIKRLSIQTIDGRSESSWPETGPGYQEEGRILHLQVPEEPFNQLALQGTLKGKIYAAQPKRNHLLWTDSNIIDVNSQNRFRTPLIVPKIRIERKSGTIRELGLFLFKKERPKLTKTHENRSLIYSLMGVNEATKVAGSLSRKIKSLYGRNLDLRMRYLPKDREAWVGVPKETEQGIVSTKQGSTRLGYQHIFLPPFLSHTLLDAIKIKLGPVTPNSPLPLVNWTVRDPVIPDRNLISVDFRLETESSTEIMFDIPDIIIPSGQPIWMTIASSLKSFGQVYFQNAEIELKLSMAPYLMKYKGQYKELFSDRFLLIRDGLQRLSQSRDWMSLDFPSSRRQFRGLNEILLLVQDVLKYIPNDPLALSFKGMLRPRTSPPQFREEPLPLNSLPKWALQQRNLVNHFKDIAEWWIRNRQVKRGGFGGGLSQDTQLVDHWPGISLLDGPSSALKESLIAVLEACLREELLQNGFNKQLKSAVSAYQAGLNLAPMLALVDYGNPRWIELLMQTSAQTGRLTGINHLGHRHFQSSYFNDDVFVDQGIHGQERGLSPLLWHSALSLAWYNGNPVVIKWLREYADSILAHWKRDRYPKLSEVIHFRSDKAMSSNLPRLPMVELMWAMFRLTGDQKYLWLFNELVQADNTEVAQLVSGRWQTLVKGAVQPKGIVDMLREYTIWNRHLHQREEGLLARQVFYELSGNKKHLLEYQGALLKHLKQNKFLYTEGGLNPAGVYIPHRATQRARLGGIAHARHQIYSGHAVSWENTSGQLAAMVLTAKSKQLKIKVWNLGETLRNVHLRIWQLENGIYEVKEGRDVDDDDEIELLMNRRILKLKRGVVIPLILRGKKSTIIRIEQLQKGTPLWQLSDLAIGREDFEYDIEADKGKLTVHNIGSGMSPPFILKINDMKGNLLIARALESLQAPQNLRPTRIDVPFSGFRSAGVESLHFRLEVNSIGEEITLKNNELWVNLDN